MADLTYPAAAMIGHKLSNFFPIFHIEAETVCLGCLAALLVGIVAAILPTRRAVGIRIAEGLRRIG